MKKLPLTLFISYSLLLNVSYAVAAQAHDPKEIKDLVQFLVSPGLLVPGKSGQSVPLSYYIGSQKDIDHYFGDYICAPAGTCHVVDSLYKMPYAILGRGLPPQVGDEQDRLQAQAQIERTDMQYGADIYDAATWQIALALAAKQGYLDKDKAEKLINNQLDNIMHEGNRATHPGFKYGYQQAITLKDRAFSYRLIATNFHNKDPFYLGKYKDYIQWDYDPEALAEKDKEHPYEDYFKYVTTWSDWKPITGENAWAQLIGPLQAEYLLYDGKIPKDSVALRNAIDSLYAFSAMQAGIGAFYYAPGGSQGNQGPIPKGEISVENNFSALGGLQILKQVLQQSEPTPKITEALKQVDGMLQGGTTVNGYKTVGLLSFLYNGAFNAKKGVFYTHGIAPNPASTHDWQPDDSESSGAVAIDINTWGMSALGVETVDQWYGEGSARRIWNTIRQGGGYYHEGALWGVGYTLHNNADDNPEQIMSTEWTAGAINALESLIAYYKGKGEDTSTLEADLASMQDGVKHLRVDQYLEAGFDNATPAAYFLELPKEAGKAYLYASKRFAIPFGWNANTLPSTTSNAWIIMNAFHFNPFQYEGKLSGEVYATPEKIDLSHGEDDERGEGLLHPITVSFNAGDLARIEKLSLNYQETEGDWKTASMTTTRQGEGVIPAGVKMIAMAYYNQGWFGVCQIPASKLCKDASCQQVHTLVAKWSADGQGACGLED